jgi:hypothetical protein
MFESIFTSTTDNAISIGPAVLSLAVAALIGLLIGISYMIACKKDGYNKNFIVGLVLLPAIVSVVILLVGSNVARAFSMAGAFALVRFRSAPGNAKDIAVVFFTMAAGLACGLGFISYALIFTVIIICILLVLSLTNFADTSDGSKQLRVTVPENLNYTDAFNDIFDKYTTESILKRVKTTNMGTLFELTYSVHLKKDVNEKHFIDELRVKNSNLNITLSVCETENTLLN